MLALEGNIPTDKNRIWIKITNYQRKNLIKEFNRADIDTAYKYRTKADYVETREEVEITKEGIISALGISKRFVDDVKSVLTERKFLE